MVVIKEGAPFVVPQGKILVVTALGSTANSIVVDLIVDGQREVQAVANIPTSGAATIGELPAGLTVQAGSTVQASTGSVFGGAWGYLADA